MRQPTPQLIHWIGLILMIACLPLLAACSGVPVQAHDSGTMLVVVDTTVVDGVRFEPAKWLQKGWKINYQPVIDPLLDCALHPHDGVPDQWVGKCYLDQPVPADGAAYITALLDEFGDGSKVTVRQIAPPVH